MACVNMTLAELKMKDHHSYPIISIGYSDIACVTLQFIRINHGLGLEPLNFGEDGDYRAYIVDEECTIPDHYQLRCEARTWLHIFDDERRTLKLSADRIKVYRAGMRGCIIQTFGRK